MGEERAAVTQSLLVRDGDGGAELQQTTGSSVTPALVLSSFVSACVCFGFGFEIGYSSPTQSEIMEELRSLLQRFRGCLMPEDCYWGSGTELLVIW
ncbi:hypothetical protein PTKIN_Ptkin01aG0328100 [Pterospermum kingtungense]